ncbi:MAG: hypothetical protein V2I46_10495, partial [Bacteroides sp.]|nr:hypothetical protein [Bacteroides sp.]
MPAGFTHQAYQEVGPKSGVTHITLTGIFRFFLKMGFVKRLQCDDYKKIRQEVHATIEPHGQKGDLSFLSFLS